MVDEAQDCSFVDWEIIYMLSSVSGNLFVVGDPDQCIYQWRGAAPRFLVDFKSDVDIVLNENYRSNQNILDAANDIISHNEMRIPKDLFSHIGEGVKPIFYYEQDEAKEGEKVVSLILGEHKSYFIYGRETKVGFNICNTRISICLMVVELYLIQLSFLLIKHTAVDDFLPYKIQVFIV